MKKIIITLIFIALVFGCTSSTSPNQVSPESLMTSETASKVSWKSVEPFAIVDYAQTADGDLALVIKNNSSSPLQLYSLQVSGTALSDSETGDNSIQNFAPNSTKLMRANAPSPCQSGETFSYSAQNIVFRYADSETSSGMQIGEAPLTGTCN